MIRRDRGAPGRPLALILAGVTAGALLVPPASAHLTDDPRHNWNRHYKRLAERLFFTKRQTNQRFFTRDQANNRFARAEHFHDGRYYTKEESDFLFGGGVAGGLLAYCELVVHPPSYAPCSVPFVTTVDDDGSVGLHTSIAVGADGTPVIAYRDETNEALKVARCLDLACTAASVTTVDDEGDPVPGGLAVGVDGNPVIAYQRVADGELRVALCEDRGCEQPATLVTVDGGVGAPAGEHVSLAMRAGGVPILAYEDGLTGGLTVTSCGEPTCAPNLTTRAAVDLDADVGARTSIAVGADGLPIVAYFADAYDAFLVASCGNAVCTEGVEVTVLEGHPDGPFEGSLAIGFRGLPVVSYYDGGSKVLRVARCVIPRCTEVDQATVDDQGDVGRANSVTVGVDGLPIVSYLDADEEDLKVARLPAG